MKIWTKAELLQLRTAHLIDLTREASAQLQAGDLASDHHQLLLDLLELIRAIIAERRAIKLLHVLRP